MAKKKNTEGAGADTPGAGSGSEAPQAADSQPGAAVSPAAPGQAEAAQVEQEPHDSAGDAGVNDPGPEPAPEPAPEPTSYIIVPTADFAFGWNGVLVQLRKDASALVEPAQLRALEAMGAPFTRKA